MQRVVRAALLYFETAGRVKLRRRSRTPGPLVRFVFLLNLESDLRQYIESYVQKSFNKCASRNKLRNMMKFFIIQKSSFQNQLYKKKTHQLRPTLAIHSLPILITTPADTLKEVSLHSVPLPPQNGSRVLRRPVQVVACDAPGDPWDHPGSVRW